jgi:hypothetical protein
MNGKVASAVRSLQRIKTFKAVEPLGVGRQNSR